MKKVCFFAITGVMLFTVTQISGQSTFGNQIFANVRGPLFRENFTPFSFTTSSKSEFKDASLFPKLSGTSFRDTVPHPGKDTLPLPHKNYLRNDDPAYNKRYPVWVPILEVPLTNVLIWSYDKFVLDASYAQISGETIKNNFKNGWEWDTDDFPTNFSLHPYTGSLYFNVARSNGYNFYQSMPFVLGGSLMWEYFMETTPPSYNDLINTTVSGIFLGEVLYRLSSSILDDRKTGGARVLREILGTVVDPERGFNRLLQGKTWRVVQGEIYQKEPLSLSVALGAHQTNDGTNFGTGTVSSMLSLNFTYGDPFEVRYRKPFDYFRLRADLSFGSANNIANNVIGDGFLFGGNMDSTHKMQMLYGGFQHYDYWNTDSFEIGTIGLGGGAITRLPIFRTGNFQNELHLAAVPLGASNETKLAAPDTATNPNFKNYSFSGGAELKYQTALNFKWGQIAAEYYFYWLHTYVGNPGDNFISILRPRISIKIYKILNIGYEYLWYYRNDHYRDSATLHVRTGEQRIFLLLHFENF